MGGASLGLLLGVLAGGAWGSSCPSSVPALALGKAYVPSSAVPTVCLEVAASEKEVPPLVLGADSGQRSSPMCLDVEVLTLPFARQQLRACGYGRVLMHLLPPTASRVYFISPRTQDGLAFRTPVAVEAGFVHAPRVAAAPPPVGKPARASAPVALSRPPNSPPPDYPTCDQRVRNVMSECQADIAKFCSVGMSEVIECLDSHRPEETIQCQIAMQQLDACEGPRLPFIPMEIASMLLLATAGVVLTCTLLRCCCRYVCLLPATHASDDASTVHDDELGTDDEDSLGSVTPLPSGIKLQEHVNQTRQRDGGASDDDELPGYAEVVQGAAVMRHPAAPPHSLE